MDTIIIKQSELPKLKSDQKTPVFLQYAIKKFIYDKVIIEIEPADRSKKNIRYEVEFADGTYAMHIKEYPLHNKWFGFYYAYNKGELQFELEVKKEAPELYRKAAATTVMIIGICYMIMQKLENRERKQVVKNNSTQKGKTYNEQKQSENKVYLLNDLINTYYVHNESKHNEISCPCWEVRGFYRHYKSGKVIWIDSFKKGKQRDKVETKPKTYIAKER